MITLNYLNLQWTKYFKRLNVKTLKTEIKNNLSFKTFVKIREVGHFPYCTRWLGRGDSNY